MSKLKELKTALDELRKNAKNILETADEIESSLSAKSEDASKKAKQEPDSESVPAEPVKEITLPEIKAVLMEKSKAGFDNEVHELIKSYDAAKLSAIDKAHYPELLAKAREIGNA